MKDQILVPLALSGDEQPILDRARQMAVEENKSLLLFHVVDLRQVEMEMAGAEFTTEDLVGYKDELVAKKRKGALHRLEEIAARLRATGITVTFEAQPGLPGRVIIRTVNRRADIAQIVMGTRHAPALERFVRGNIAAKVQRRAHYPVTIVTLPPRAAIA